MTRKIRTALLAYGASGKLFHAPFLKVHDGFELIGAWERSSKNIQNDYPDAQSFSSLEAVLNSNAELVIVNTPIDTHYEFTRKVLEAGKHALVEKAFTTTAQEAQELYRLAAEKNLIVCVYQNRRYDSDFLTVRKILEEGHLGEIVEAEIRFERYSPALSDKKWKETGAPGTGIVMDLGAHIIDQALVLFGLPEKIFADVRKIRNDSRIDDYFDLLLYYPDKRVRLEASMLVKEPTPSYVFHGRKGSFLKHRGDIQEDDLKRGSVPNRDAWGTESAHHHGLLVYSGNIVNVPAVKGNYLRFFDALYDGIVNHNTIPVTASEAFNTIRLMEAAIESSEKQKAVTL